MGSNAVRDALTRRPARRREWAAAVDVVLEGGATFANTGGSDAAWGSAINIRSLTLEGDATVAATHTFGLGWVLVDEGWCRKGDISAMADGFDLDAIAAYAASRGVRVMLWTAWRALDGRQEEIFGAFAKRGVAGRRRGRFC